MLRYAVCAVMIGVFGAAGSTGAHADGTTVYVTGIVHPSLLTICPCADPFVVEDNSLNEDLFLAGDDLEHYEGAKVEIVGERIDCGDCIKIAVQHVAFLPPNYPLGDLSGDNLCTAPDVIIGINYLLKNGLFPKNGWRSVDLNGDGQTNMADLVRLVSIVYGRAATIQGAVWGTVPCLETAGPYQGCRYWIIKNSIPLDTGTVDEDGEFSALLPPDRYLLQLFPLESRLPGTLTFDLTHGNVVLPAPMFPREFVDSLLLVTLRDGVLEARLDQIMGYLGGHVTGINMDGAVIKYVVALSQGFHFDRAAAILRLFPEVALVESIPILCP